MGACGRSLRKFLRLGKADGNTGSGSRMNFSAKESIFQKRERHEHRKIMLRFLVQKQTPRGGKGS